MYSFLCSPHYGLYTPKNARLRTQQIYDIVDVLRSLSLPFITADDLNLHYLCEDTVVVDHRFIDDWAQTHFSQVHPFNDQNPGYTCDAVKTILVPHYIPGESRQMRLDRILFSQGFPAFVTLSCTIWMNSPIKRGHYLFPNDHFGLHIDICLGGPYEWRSAIMHLGETDTDAQELFRYHAGPDALSEAYRPRLIRTAITWAYHIVCLGAATMS